MYEILKILKIRKIMYLIHMSVCTNLFRRFQDHAAKLKVITIRLQFTRLPQSTNLFKDRLSKKSSGAHFGRKIFGNVYQRSITSLCILILSSQLQFLITIGQTRSLLCLYTFKAHIPMKETKVEIPGLRFLQ